MNFRHFKRYLIASFGCNLSHSLAKETNLSKVNLREENRGNSPKRGGNCEKWQKKWKIRKKSGKWGKKVKTEKKTWKIGRKKIMSNRIFFKNNLKLTMITNLISTRIIFHIKCAICPILASFEQPQKNEFDKCFPKQKRVQANQRWNRQFIPFLLIKSIKSLHFQFIGL